jgi:hypothetical protein
MQITIKELNTSSLAVRYYLQYANILKKRIIIYAADEV